MADESARQVRAPLRQKALRRTGERAELLVNITQGVIVEKQGFINFGEALKDGGRGASPHFFRQHRLEKNAGLTPTPKVAIATLNKPILSR